MAEEGFSVGFGLGEFDELERDIYERMRKYAEKNGYRLNPNQKIVRALIKALARNYRKYGALYCPCRRRTGDPERDKLIICPYAYHKKEIENYGKCHCGLFVKSD